MATEKHYFLSKNKGPRGFSVAVRKTRAYGYQWIVYRNDNPYKYYASGVGEPTITKAKKESKLWLVHALKHMRRTGELKTSYGTFKKRNVDDILEKLR